MRWMFSALAMMLVIGTAVHGQDTKVNLQVVKYEGLKQIIQANQGKVIWVDFWLLACGPCRDRFPHAIDMHNKYGKDGLVVVSVCVDPPALKPQVQNYLNSINAQCINVLLDEPFDLLEQKMRIPSFPCYYVFDRQGKWVQFVSEPGEINNEAVDRLLMQLLNEKK